MTMTKKLVWVPKFKRRQMMRFFSRSGLKKPTFRLKTYLFATKMS
jgi:hypothetical protein